MRPDDPRVLEAMSGLFWVAFVVTAIGMFAHRMNGWLP